MSIISQYKNTRDSIFSKHRFFKEILAPIDIELKESTTDEAKYQLACDFIQEEIQPFIYMLQDEQIDDFFVNLFYFLTGYSSSKVIELQSMQISKARDRKYKQLLVGFGMTREQLLKNGYVSPQVDLVMESTPTLVKEFNSEIDQYEYLSSLTHVNQEKIEAVLDRINQIKDILVSRGLEFADDKKLKASFLNWSK